MTYAEGVTQLEGRARLAAMALWAFVAVSALTLGAELLEATGTIDIEVDTDALALGAALAYLAYTVVFVVSVVFVARWIHRAHANLREGGMDGLEFTPGWAVGWYFIPVMNLFKPYQAMKELWSASHGVVDRVARNSPSEVKWWWAAWITGNILSSVGTRILMTRELGEDSVTVGNAVSAAGTAGVLLAALLLMRLIEGVTQAQRGGQTAVGVFA